MDFLLFFFSKSTTSSTSTPRASEPLTAKSSTRSSYDTISEKTKPGHRKALFDRVPERGRSMSRSTSSRRGSGVASLDLMLLLDQHGYFS
jgi:hypothetical protein